MFQKAQYDGSEGMKRGNNIIIMTRSKYQGKPK